MKNIINKATIRKEVNTFIDNYKKKQDFFTLITNFEKLIQSTTSAEAAYILAIDDVNEEINILSQDKTIVIDDMQETFSVILECYYTKKVHHAKNLITSFLYNSEIDKLVDYPLKEILVTPLLDPKKNIIAVIWVAYSKNNPEEFTQVDVDNINCIASFMRDILIDRVEPSTPQQEEQQKEQEEETLNILIVDDDIIILKFLSTVLKQQGFGVEIAHSGIEALKIYKSSDGFDLIFMDEVMNGGMHGHQAVEKIRAIEEYSHQRRIPIIALTSDTSKDTRRLLLKSGVDMVLYKPIDPNRILDVIARMSAT